MTLLANYWASKSWQVTIATFDKRNPFFKLAPEVKLRSLNISKQAKNHFHGFLNNLHRIRVVRNTIKSCQPDIVISFLSKPNVITLISSIFTKIPIVVSERNNPKKSPTSQYWRILRLFTYPLAQCIIVQTKQIKGFFPGFLRKLIRVIPNPVITPDEEKNGNCLKFIRPAIVAAGRLHPQKGFDILIRAFAKIKKNFPGWSLVIMGEGDMRQELESLCNSLEVNRSVFMPGVVNNPYSIFKKADLFVLSSRYEGFPNALCEAMACGLPVIAADCQTGPSDIIKHDINGILVPEDNIDALAAAMKQLISNNGVRKRLGEKAVGISAQFSIGKISGMWEKLLKNENV